MERGQLCQHCFASFLKSVVNYKNLEQPIRENLAHLNTTKLTKVFIILACLFYAMYAPCTPLMYNIKTRVIQGQTLFGGFAELYSLKQAFQVLTFGILWQGLNLS